MRTWMLAGLLIAGAAEAGARKGKGAPPPSVEATPAVRAGLPPPPDVAAPPADAERTASGLAWKLLEPGPEGARPTGTSRVTVHYTGWLTDGRMIDSSVLRGEPMRLPLNAVVTGWSEGLQAMVVGEKRRLWIPEGLAYKGAPGRPPGMLVFDVELLEIEPELTAPTP